MSQPDQKPLQKYLKYSDEQDISDWIDTIQSEERIQDKNNKFDVVRNYLNLLGLQEPLLSDIISNSRQLGNQTSFKKELEGFFQYYKVSKLVENQNNPLNQKLVQNNFVIIQNELQQPLVNCKLKIKVIESMQTYEIVQVFCQLGKYAKRYTIYNSRKESWRHNCHNVGFGSFGSAFVCKQPPDSQFIVKCLNYKNNNLNILKNHIKEFFIADLMSALKIGPKILKKSGFDFIVFPNCMEFDMEMCSESNLSRLQADLKQSLLKMHLLKVVHCDIKPANVMYSKFYEKNVFVDFGIAEIIQCQLWQSVPTHFKGTYQFCGKQMKQIFAQKGFGVVNLYLNDFQMLNATINKFKYDKDQNYHFLELPQQKQSTRIQENYINEKIAFLKFLIYKFQTTTIMNYLQTVIDQHEKIVENKQRIIKEVQYFIQNFQQQTKIQIINKILWKNQSIKSLYCQQALNDYKHAKFKIIDQNLCIIESNPIKTIYQKLEILEQHNDFALHYNAENSKNSIFYLLTNKIEPQHFSKEDYFEKVLHFVSFWKSPLRVSIQQKQTVAQTMKLYLQNSVKENVSHFQYLQDKYLPEHDFVLKNCKNLVWIYAYLLYYCMEGQLNQFKFKNLMTILKDCIFLSFKYYLFLRECLLKYFNHLIKQKKNALITEAVIQFGQLVFLTKSHFLIQTKKKVKQNEKCLHKYLKCFIHDFIQRNQFLFKDSETIKACKVECFKQIWKLFQENHNITDNIFEKPLSENQFNPKLINDLVQFIEEQFTQNKNMHQISFFEKAVRIIYYCKPEFNNQVREATVNSSIFKNFFKFKQQKKEFDIIKLVQLNPYMSKKLMKESVQYIHQRINCQQISFCFIPSHNLRIRNPKRDKNSLTKIWQIAFSNIESALLNIRLFSMVSYHTVEVQYFTYFQGWADYMIKKSQIILNLMQQFSQKPWNYVHQLSGFIWSLQDQLPIQKKMNQIILLFQKKFNIKYLKVLEILFTNNSTVKRINILTYYVANEILNRLAKYSKHYLQHRLRFFSYFLNENIQFQRYYQSLKNNKQVRTFMVDQNNSNIQHKIEWYSNFKSQTQLYNYESNIYLFSQIFEPHDLSEIKQSQTYWEIKKAKLFMFKEIYIIRHIPAIIKYFLKLKKFQDIAQVFVHYCIVCNQSRTTQTYLNLLSMLNQLKQSCEDKRLSRKMFYTFVNLLKKLESNHSNRINQFDVFPIYLSLVQYTICLIYEPKVFSKILFKLYCLYPKFTAFNSIQLGQAIYFSVKQLMFERMLFCSINCSYLIKTVRKRIILIKLLIKNITSNGTFGRVSYRQIFDQLLNIITKNQLKYVIHEKIKDRYKKHVKKIFKNFFMSSSVSFELFERQFKNCYYNPNVDIEQKYLSQLNKIPVQKQSDREFVQRITKQTLQIRLKLQNLEYQKIKQKLWNQKQKTIKDLSWIQALNP